MHSSAADNQESDAFSLVQSGLDAEDLICPVIFSIVAFFRGGLPAPKHPGDPFVNAMAVRQGSDFNERAASTRFPIRRLEGNMASRCGVDPTSIFFRRMLCVLDL